MRELIDFLAQCAQSGTLLTSLCAIVLLPVGAWVACRLVAPCIVRMTDDPAWQAPLACAAAALPGGLFVALWIGALVSGLGSACLSLPAGRVAFGFIIAAMIGALARATWLASVRAIEIRNLIRSTSAASPRLSRIASSCGLNAREFRLSIPICALAGLRSPVVLMSTGALAAVSDDELRAALFHERAHARRGDQWLSSVLTFLVDLLPLPASDLVQTYHTAREVAADSESARCTGVESIAGALIGFAKTGRSLAGASSLVENDRPRLTTRLHALLKQPPSLRPGYNVRRVAVALTLALIALTTVTTPVVAGEHSASCSISMKVDR